MSVEAPSVSPISASISGGPGIGSPEISVGGSRLGGFSFSEFGPVSPPSLFSPESTLGKAEGPFSGGIFAIQAKGGASESSPPGVKAGSLDILGPPHQLSEEIFSSDKALAKPASIFDAGTFAITAKPRPDLARTKNPKNSGSEIFGPKLELGGEAASESAQTGPEEVFNGNLFEVLVRPAILAKTAGKSETKTSRDLIFGQRLESAAPSIKEGPVGAPQLKESKFEYRFVQAADLFPQKGRIEDEEEEELRLTRRLIAQEIKNGENSVLQILLGEALVSVSPEVKAELKTTTEDQTQAQHLDKKSQGVATIQAAALAAIRTEESLGNPASKAESTEELPKETLWKAGGKNPGQKELAQTVLTRRVRLASEVVSEAVDEETREATGERKTFLLRIKGKLGKLDVPTSEEVLKMVFGKLTFPFVAKEAAREIEGIKPEEATPGGVLKTLREILVKKPPQKAKNGLMEQDGYLPESKLPQVSAEAGALARQGASHIVYDGKKWRAAGAKPFEYPLELDKTKKAVFQAVDSKESPWYTLFAQRAKARVKRKISQSQ